MKEKCYQCSGSGKLFLNIDGTLRKKKCPSCGGTGFIVTAQDLEVKQKDVSRVIVDYIPNDYFRESEYDRRALERDIGIPQNLRDIVVDMYFDFNDILLSTIRMGGIPRKSYLISALDGMGKKWLVYTAIKYALQAGLTPTKLLDSKDIYTYLNKLQYDLLMEALEGDIVFMTLGGAPSKGDVIALKEVIDICERKGRPLIVISRFDGMQLTRYDTSLSASIGAKAVRDGDYGRLEQQGIYGATMEAVRNYFSQSRRV